MKLPFKWLPIAALLIGVAACSGGSGTGITPSAGPMVQSGAPMLAAKPGALDLTRLIHTGANPAVNPAAIPPGLPSDARVRASGSFNGNGNTYTDTVQGCFPVASVPGYDSEDGNLYWALYDGSKWMLKIAGKGDIKGANVCWDSEKLKPPITLDKAVLYSLALYQYEDEHD